MSKTLTNSIGALNSNNESLLEITKDFTLTYGTFTTKGLILMHENDNLFKLTFNLSGKAISPTTDNTLVVKNTSEVDGGYFWNVHLISSNYSEQPSVKIQISYKGLYISRSEDKAVLSNNSGDPLEFVLIEPGDDFMKSMCFTGANQTASSLTICQNYFYNYPDKKLTGKFCSTPSDMERPICMNYCKDNDCNNVLYQFCNSSNNKNSPYCGCFLNKNFYDNYSKSIKDNGYNPLTFGSPYYYPDCLNSAYHLFESIIPKDAQCVILANTNENGSISTSLVTRLIADCYNFNPKIPIVPKPAPLYIPKSKTYKKKSELVIVIPVAVGVALLFGIIVVSIIHKSNKK